MDEDENERETEVVTLQEYLKKYMPESTHETIRKSVLNATRNFNHRVKAFYRHIVKGSSNRMSIGFYNYRIEFQDRGAGHVHGVLWVDFDAFENNESNIEDFADKNEEEIGAGVKKLRSAFKKFKDDEVLSVEEYEKVTKFVDTFISCSTDPEIVQTKLYRVKLKKKHIPRRENISKEIQRDRKTFDEAEKSDNESLDSSDSENSDSDEKCRIAKEKKTLESKKKNISEHIAKTVSEVQVHHHTKSCRKYGTNCRFNFPKFPTKETILAIPVDKLSKYIEDDKWVLADDDSENVKNLKKTFEHFKHLDETERKDLLAEYKNILQNVQNALIEVMTDKDLFQNSNIDEILEIAGTSWDEYKTALSISFSGGYKIIHRRTVKDIMVNTYNPEFMYAWNGNSDLQMCPDYYSVISYIANYVTKDDSTTMEHLTQAAKEFGRESLKEKMNLMKNIFLTYRQMGEAEAIYRLLPSFHFKDSNLVAKFLSTGFKENRSRFLQKIHEDNKFVAYGREKIAVSGKEGMYVEKPSIIDKYERRPVIDSNGKEDPLRQLCLAQFVKEYEPANKPESKKKPKVLHSENEDSDSDESENEVDEVENEPEVPKVDENTRFIKTCHEGKDENSLPKWIKLTSTYPGEPKYMRLRSHPAALRYHKYKKDHHEFFYSELLLYRPFVKETNSIREGGLLECRDDLEMCLQQYGRKSSQTFNAKEEETVEQTDELTEEQSSSVELSSDEDLANPSCNIASFSSSEEELQKIRQKTGRLYNVDSTSESSDTSTKDSQNMNLDSDSVENEKSLKSSGSNEDPNSLTDLEIVKMKVMPHLKNVEEGRLRAEEAMQMNELIGAEIDPENEQENDDLENEELTEHPEHLALQPGDSEFVTNDAVQGKQNYRKIELTADDELCKRTRCLDAQQRMVVDIAITYAKNLFKSLSGKGQLPKPPKLVIQGGAGSGKSTVIKIMTEWMEKILRKPGDNPNMPYIIKAAFTGSASSLIDGQTLHSAFNLPFGNEYVQMSDKVADEKRTELQNLKVLIIDEMSLVKADLLYQLHQRLREITMQRNKEFGNIAIFLFGDLLQIPPVKSPYIFAEPQNKDYKADYDMEPLWWKFDSIRLETNHRQGRNKVWADLLNRMSVGELTEDDLKLLQTRVFPENSPEIPAEAFNVRCTNKEVSRINEEKLNANPNEEVILEAIHVQPTKGNYKPKLNDGKVGNTALVDCLKLKIGCEVMLNYNLDVCDSLVNGSRGTVVDFVKFPNGKIRFVLVQFHDEKAGQQRRKQFPNIQKKYPDNRPVPIEKIEINYSLSKKQFSQGAFAKVFQVPLTLGYSCTGHKSQGSTISEPDPVVTDLRKSFLKSMCYVICSRTETKEQLYILGKLPTGRNAFNCNPNALDEVNQLTDISLNKNPSSWFKDIEGLKISCLNVRSLSKHFEDLKVDFSMLKSNILVLTETWIPPNTNDAQFQLEDFYPPIINSIGRGKGLCIYYDNEEFAEECNANGENFQITKITSENLDVIGVYRSENGNKTELISNLQEILSPTKDTVILGDFNIDYLKDQANVISSTLRSLGFKQVVKQPTHILGSLLDHAYVRIADHCVQGKTDVFTHSPYYSDHDAICLIMSNSTMEIPTEEKSYEEIYKEQKLDKRKIFRATVAASSDAAYAVYVAERAFVDLKNSENENEANQAIESITSALDKAIFLANIATNASEKVKAATRHAKAIGVSVDEITELLASAMEFLNNKYTAYHDCEKNQKEQISRQNKRKAADPAIKPLMKQQIVATKAKNVSKSTIQTARKRTVKSKKHVDCPEITATPPKQKKMVSDSLKKDTVKTKNTETPENVCPVCKLGPFQGGHQCIACKRMVHIFCGKPIGEEGFGQKILCNDCH